MYARGEQMGRMLVRRGVERCQKLVGRQRGLVATRRLVRARGRRRGGIHAGVRGWCGAGGLLFAAVDGCVLTDDVRERGVAESGHGACVWCRCDLAAIRLRLRAGEGCVYGKATFCGTVCMRAYSQVFPLASWRQRPCVTGGDEMADAHSLLRNTRKLCHTCESSHARLIPSYRLRPGDARAKSHVIQSRR